MYWVYILYISVITTASVGFTILAGYAWLVRGSSITYRYYAWFTSVIAVMSFAFVLGQLSRDPVTAFFWVQVRFSTLALAPISILAFTLAYLNYDHWLRLRYFVPLLIIPAVTLLIAWFTPNLIWVSWTLVRSEFLSIEMPVYTGWIGIHLAHIYSYICVAIALLLHHLLQSAPPNRGQSLWLTIGMAVALLLGAVNILLVRLGVVIPNLTVLGIAMLGLASTWAIVRFRFLSVAPIAYNQVIDTMGDAVFVLDLAGHVLQLNSAAEALLQRSVKLVRNKPLANLLPVGSFDLSSYLVPRKVRGEVTLSREGLECHYDIDSAPVYQSKQHVGYVIVLRDMTEQKLSAYTLQHQNDFLTAQYTLVFELLKQSDMHNLMQRIIDQAALILDAPFGEIMLAEGEELVASAYTPKDAALHIDRVKRGEGLLIWQAYDTRQPAVIEDYATWHARRSVYQPFDAHASAVFPIVVEDECLGVMGLGRHKPNYPFSAEHIQQGVLFSRLAALAIRSAQHQEQARALAAADERQRIARELHDSVTQMLFSASIVAQALPRLWQEDPQELNGGLDMLTRLTRGALAEMRTLLIELRPASLLKTDLSELIGYLLDATAGRSTVNTSLSIRGLSMPPPDVQIVTYRIAQEALQNVVKHAHARQISAVLERDVNFVSLTIGDDGRGFEMNAVAGDHFGVQIMRERAESIGAQLQINSEKGRGTTVHFIWKGQRVN